MAKFLALGSKADERAAIYLRSDAPADVLFQAASERQYAVRDLLEAISRCEINEGEAKGISGLARAAALLVGDAESLYEAAHRSASI